MNCGRWNELQLRLVLTIFIILIIFVLFKCLLKTNLQKGRTRMMAEWGPILLCSLDSPCHLLYPYMPKFVKKPLGTRPSTHSSLVADYFPPSVPLPTYPPSKKEEYGAWDAWDPLITAYSYRTPFFHSQLSSLRIWLHKTVFRNETGHTDKGLESMDQPLAQSAVTCHPALLANPEAFCPLLPLNWAWNV